MATFMTILGFLDRFVLESEAGTEQTDGQTDRRGAIHNAACCREGHIFR